MTKQHVPLGFHKKRRTKLLHSCPFDVASSLCKHFCNWDGLILKQTRILTGILEQKYTCREPSMGNNRALVYLKENEFLMDEAQLYKDANIQLHPKHTLPTNTIQNIFCITQATLFPLNNRAVLNGSEKKVFRNQFSQKSPRTPCAQPWFVAVGGWQLATGGWWRLVVVGGGWWLVIGGWWRLAVVGSWRLVATGGWRRLVVGGGWWLVVGGWWRLAVVGSWRLVAAGGWRRLVVGGWWRLAVGG